MESIKSPRPYNRIIENPSPQQTNRILTKTQRTQIIPQQLTPPPPRPTIPQIITYPNTHPIIPQYLPKPTTMSINNIKI